MPLPKLLKRRDNGASANPADGSPVDSEAEGRLEKPAGEYDQTPVRFLRLRILAMALIVSMGGLIFGYDTGQISGFVQMPDFIARFAGPSGSFSNWKEGLIVGLVRPQHRLHACSN